MAHQKGSTAKVAVGFEAAFKTPASAGFVMPFLTSGMSGDQARNKSAVIQEGRNPRAPFLGNKDAKGPLVVPVDTVAMLYWLKAMFGAAAVTGSGPYVHAYKIGDDMPSITFEHRYPQLDTPKYEQFYGCKVASAGFSFGDGNAELVANLQLLGADFSIEDAPFDAAATVVPQAKVYNSQASFQEGGAAYALARRVDLNVNFGLDETQFTIGGGGTRRSIPEGAVEIGGEVEAVFESTALLEKAENDMESSLVVTVTGGASSVFELQLQEIKYARRSPGIQTPAGLVVTLGFEAYFEDGSEASAIVARVTNSIAAAV